MTGMMGRVARHAWLQEHRTLARTDRGTGTGGRRGAPCGGGAAGAAGAEAAPRGASGGTLKGGRGDRRFLDPFLYDPECKSGSGTTDYINWKMLFDSETLGAKVARGDTMPGPGLTAIITAISEKACAGDSGRGAVAEALVEALACDAAANTEFSVGAAEGESAPSRDEWARKFADAR